MKEQQRELSSTQPTSEIDAALARSRRASKIKGDPVRPETCPVLAAVQKAIAESVDLNAETLDL